MKLIVDEQVQGSESEFQTVAELKEAVLDLVDERVTEVIIKKRAPERGPSQNDVTCAGTELSGYEGYNIPITKG